MPPPPLNTTPLPPLPPLVEPPPLLPLPLPLPPVEAPVNGLLSDETVAEVRSRVKLEWSSCCWMLWLLLAELMALPDFQAAIQLVLAELRDMEPPLQDAQLVQRTLATILPFETPEPPRRVRAAPLSETVGMLWPRAVRGLMVTLPAPSVYMMNMLELDMVEPVPRATHW